MSNRKEKRKQRKAWKKERKSASLTPSNGKWLSNASQGDATRIKRAFPNVTEGLPKATERSSTSSLQKDGIVGLYLQEKKHVQ